MKSIVSCLLVCFALTSLGQDEFTLKSTQSMSTDDEEMQSLLEMMGTSEMTIYVKKDLMRVRLSNGLTGTSVIVSNNETGNGILLMDGSDGSKTYMEIEGDSENEPEEDELAYSILSTKKKKYLGYKCKKYMLQDSNQDKCTIYVATSLNSGVKTQYGDDITGQVLYSESIKMIEGSQLTIIMEATEIEIGDVDDALFDMSIPEGYTLSGDE